MTGEKLTLVFKDGTRFNWDTTSIKDSKLAIRAQKLHGDPMEIIGDGKTAALLRRKYEEYNQDTEAYNADLLGAASELSGVAKEKLASDFEKAKQRISPRWLVGRRKSGRRH